MEGILKLYILLYYPVAEAIGCAYNPISFSQLRLNWHIVALIMADDPGANDGPQIPKYVTKVPWYQKERQKDENDYHSHHLKNPQDGPVDYSEAQHGPGFQESSDTSEQYDSKRDRWQGFDASDYVQVANQWDRMKAKAVNAGGRDSEDYGVEMIELGLEYRDFRSSVKQDVEEKTIRDRNDVPEYIKRISAGKIRADQPNLDIVTSDDQFVRPTIKGGHDLGSDFEATRAFAWDQDRIFKQDCQQVNLELLLESLTSTNASNMHAYPQTNLNASMEASPTATVLQARKDAEKKRQSKLQLRQNLLAKYGDGTADETLGGTADGSERAAKVATNGTPRVIDAEINDEKYHPSAWGSYYKDGSWGYSCCHSTDKSAPCTKK